MPDKNQTIRIKGKTFQLIDDGDPRLQSEYINGITQDCYRLRFRELTDVKIPEAKTTHTGKLVETNGN